MAAVRWPTAFRRLRTWSFPTCQGPDASLYLAGARLKTYWPVSIVEHGLGLNITLQSYAGSLDFGILAARVGMPDARPLAHGLHAALAELARATDSVSPAAAAAPDKSVLLKPAARRRSIARVRTRTSQ